MIYWPSAQNSFFKLPGELLIPVVLFAVKIIIFMLNTSCPNPNEFKIVRLNSPQVPIFKIPKTFGSISNQNFKGVLGDCDPNFENLALLNRRR